MRMLAILCAVVLSGCSYVSPFVDRYDKAADDVFKGVHKYICDELRMRVWIEHYGSSAAKAAGWRAECAPEAVELPVQQK